jgi:hypothetical protein
MSVRRARGVPIQGAQYGDHNVQRNYFAPVTENLFVGGFERLRDVWFDPAVLARDLDLARFTGREWLTVGTRGSSRSLMPLRWICPGSAGRWQIAAPGCGST